MRSRGLLVVAGLLISALAAAFVLARFDIQGARDTLARAQLPPIGLALILLAGGLALRSVRWSILLGSQPGERPTAGRVAPVMLVGYLGNTLLPARLGELLRAWLITRRCDVSLAQAVSSVVVERVVDTTVLALLASMAAIGLRAPAWIVQLSVVVAIVAGAVLGLLAAGAAGAAIRALVRAARPVPSLSAALLRLSIAVAPIDRYGPSRIAAAAGLSALAWCMDSAVVWLAGVALSIGISPGVALLITAVTVLGTAVPAAPGYLGTFELALAATAGAFGVPPAQGLALGLLAHAVSLIPITLAGVVSAVVLGVRPRDMGQARGLRTGEPEVREA